ncbi:MAG: hypothetical protein P4N24_04715 [Acidobacteriota bacterium]|nr:hypothetical protein [Acidobacteriota bacterium]
MKTNELRWIPYDSMILKELMTIFAGWLHQFAEKLVCAAIIAAQGQLHGQTTRANSTIKPPRRSARHPSSSEEGSRQKLPSWFRRGGVLSDGVVSRADEFFHSLSWPGEDSLTIRSLDDRRSYRSYKGN